MCGTLPAPRVAVHRTLRRPADGESLDRGLVIWFPGPASFTGEDVAEFHVHGGRAVVEAVLAALASQPGCRLAMPGEFTRRAFLAGKLDLTAAEGLADLVAADTEAQRRAALHQASGSLGRLYDGWRERLLSALARAEAAIDFPDEAEIEDGLFPAAVAEAGRIVEAIAAHLAAGDRAARLREGVSVVILGAPNVGKSSLLNALTRREIAITSAAPGTTRDVIEAQIDLDGIPVYLADTAGLRETDDPVEAEGIRRARDRAARADLRVLVQDATAPDAGEAAAEFRVVTKIDRLSPRSRPAPGPGLYPVSNVTGEGIAAFLEALAVAVRERAGSDGLAPTRARHREALAACVDAVHRARTAPFPELAAEELRVATAALGRLTGRVDVSDILDRIFGEFCLGK